ncbi:MAG: sulfurtransferase [Chloroflexi bacterium]|nr:sulfurtransferase [Chloroflexota bacterium]MCI0579639.1 sulfurtransferase [Chloroflexota bacterium]MCI0644387.1 sulfurtransferase [Chloroflexota bacterium]MCI0727360.1 sulfurtransferase [Chloroflexota bacterium]
MAYTTLLTPKTVYQHLDDPTWVIVDCRFNLADTEAGRRAYEQGHVPGAVYAHVDRDLSGPPVTDRGRHPLPTPEALRATFSRLGIDRSKQVVAYDEHNGSYAARLWWLLGYMGHQAAAVLDGGWRAWLAAGYPTAVGVETNSPARFQGEPRRDRVVFLDEVPLVPLLVDSRDPARYRGEVEPIDPAAGHIPGAINHPFGRNVDAQGRFLPAEELRRQFDELLGETPAGEAVFYCGSGVTACQNLLALAQAGLGAGRLYAGSWSEWCADPERPIESDAKTQRRKEVK